MSTLTREGVSAKVAMDERGCWIWQGAYGVRGTRPRYGDEYAYRVSYRLFVGAIPSGMQINHHCDVPSCVNPEHLYAGTQQQNVRDMVERRRYVVPMLSGEQIANAHPDVLVDEVRARYQRGEQQQELAAEYGLALGTVRKWCSGGARGRAPIKRQRSSCGTRAGYCSHQRRGEVACDPCRAANTEYLRDYKAKRRLLAHPPT